MSSLNCVWVVFSKHPNLIGARCGAHFPRTESQAQDVSQEDCYIEWLLSNTVVRELRTT